MKTEITRITDAYAVTADGNNWTGINALQALEGITAETATKRFHAGHLNIAELTAHLACWNKVMAKRLDGENHQPTKEEDFPEIEHLSQEEWIKLKEKLFESFIILKDKLENKSDDILEAPMFEGSTTAYRNLHGQVAHLHYHIGQIVLLKKLLS